MTLSEKLDLLDERIAQWERLGLVQHPDGTREVGQMPHRGPLAYLHHAYGPLSESEIEGLEKNIGLLLPGDLSEFYLRHNGINLFSSKLYMYGVRRSYDRADLDAMACNPFDIISMAIIKRKLSPSGVGVVVSSYPDKSHVFVEPAGRVVRVLEDRDNAVLNEWSDLGDWVLTEFDRLNLLVDKFGEAISRDETIFLPPISSMVPAPDFIRH